MPLRAFAAAIALLALALSATSHAVRAQATDPARLAAAKEMMRAAKVERQFEQMMPILLDRLRESFRTLAPDRRDAIDSVFGEMEKKFLSRRDELIADVAALYAQRLDTEELNAVTAFYKSGAGAKFIEVQPQIMQEAMAAGHRWGQKIAREMEEEARRELKKRGIEL
jgi:uncharacterized protein